MKKFIAVFQDFEIGVYTETPEEARKIAIDSIISFLKKDLDVIEMTARTERCDGCRYLFGQYEVVKRNCEQLCWGCNWQKYRLEDMNLNDIDIPF